ncbi:MAG TPA: hypothetical protein VJB06_00185 [archaeon]|nr:hypothetical protein [archaeon]
MHNLISKPDNRKLKDQLGLMEHQPFSFPKRKGLRSQKKRNFKGQFGLMEHLLMAVILLMVIVGALFFFLGFQSTKGQAEGFKDDIHKIILSSNILAQSEMLTKEDQMFDDSKLVGFTGGYEKDGCEEIKKLVGEACITIDKVLISEERDDCDPVNFDQRGRDSCNSWTLCKETCFKLQSGKSKGLALPVNVYRSLDKKVELAVMTVKVPG